MQSLFAVLVVLLLVGCATPPPPVIPAGKDSYIVNVHCCVWYCTVPASTTAELQALENGADAILAVMKALDELHGTHDYHVGVVCG